MNILVFVFVFVIFVKSFLCCLYDGFVTGRNVLLSLFVNIFVQQSFFTVDCMIVCCNVGLFSFGVVKFG